MTPAAINNLSYILCSVIYVYVMIVVHMFCMCLRETISNVIRNFTRIHVVLNQFYSNLFTALSTLVLHVVRDDTIHVALICYVSYICYGSFLQLTPL